MKVNRTLASATLAYKDARSDIFASMLADSNRDSYSNSSSSSSTLGRRSREGHTLITRRMPPLSFHNKPKKFIKESIEKFCSASKVKPCLDGDQEELVRFYKEMIHLHNAQIGSMEPLSLDDVVKEINKKEALRKKESKNTIASKALATRMVNGEVSI